MEDDHPFCTLTNNLRLVLLRIESCPAPKKSVSELMPKGHSFAVHSCGDPGDPRLGRRTFDEVIRCDQSQMNQRDALEELSSLHVGDGDGGYNRCCEAVKICLLGFKKRSDFEPTGTNWPSLQLLLCTCRET